ncbi:MAG: AbrB/MazE/SpoVT family DNA-binding domain-containing protein [Coriobacteriales bacterium]|nr:AbrB/MazE/SpoVT family DNA-binding domain-containing protein [Coriobacteriales bacterium]
MQTTIQKWGNSSAVRIPKPLLESAGIGPSDRIRLLIEGGDIIIRKVERPEHITLAQRLAASGETAADYANAKEWDETSVGQEVFW